MRISLLAGELQAMRLSSSGALLSGAASSRLFQLITSVLTLLFTTSSIVSTACVHVMNPVLTLLVTTPATVTTSIIVTAPCSIYGLAGVQPTVVAFCMTPTPLCPLRFYIACCFLCKLRTSVCSFSKHQLPHCMSSSLLCYCVCCARLPTCSPAQSPTGAPCGAYSLA